VLDLIRENKRIAIFIAVVCVVVISIIVIDQIKRWAGANTPTDSSEVGAALEDTPIESFFKQSTTSPTLVYDPIENTNESLIDAVVKTYLAQVLSMDAITPNDTELRSFFAREVISEARRFIEIPPKYTAANISTFTTQDINKIKQYGNNLAEVLYYYGNLFETIPPIDNPDRYVPLVTRTFLLFADDITKILVPQEVSSTHISLANNLYKTGVLLERMLHISTEDSLQEYLSLQEYEMLKTQQNELFKKIANYFRENDILFESNEYGIFWQNL